MFADDNTTFVEIVYDNYASTLYGVLFKILKDEVLAEDALQQTIIKIWKNASTFNASKGRVFTWMLNIARNTAFDILKSKEIKYKIKNQDEELLVSQSDNYATTNTKIDAIGLNDVLQKMDASNKKLLDLMYFQGYTHQEIADELSMPLGTVKTKLRNAILQLRKIITFFL